MIQQILDIVGNFGVLQWAAFLLNSIYIWLASHERSSCWIFGFFGTIATFFVSLNANLKSDATLQIYYGFSAVYGWLSWQGKVSFLGVQKPKDDLPLQVSSMAWRDHLLIILIGALASNLLGNLWSSAAWRYGDAFLTTFSVIATLLTARKIVETWVYWVVIDAGYAIIYGERGVYLLALLSIVYTFFSVKGYFNWKKKIILKQL
ncbi:MAG: nicotinamide mononucleotide transporter PnuC [Bacteroidota bacterium]|jgi:nicotinamide mononucleotide transporter